MLEFLRGLTAPTLHWEGGVARGKANPPYHISAKLTTEFSTPKLCWNSNKHGPSSRAQSPSYSRANNSKTFLNS